eukprot:1566339-Prymnesium_polylepis.1
MPPDSSRPPNIWVLATHVTPMSDVYRAQGTIRKCQGVPRVLYTVINPYFVILYRGVEEQVGPWTWCARTHTEYKRTSS